MQENWQTRPKDRSNGSIITAIVVINASRKLHQPTSLRKSSPSTDALVVDASLFFLLSLSRPNMSHNVLSDGGGGMANPVHTGDAIRSINPNNHQQTHHHQQSRITPTPANSARQHSFEPIQMPTPTPDSSPRLRGC